MGTGVTPEDAILLAIANADTRIARRVDSFEAILTGLKNDLRAIVGQPREAKAGRIMSDKQRTIMRACVAAAAKEYGVDARTITSRTHEHVATGPRYTAMWLAKQCSDATWMQMGDFFNRDHSTIIHACWWIEGKLPKSELRTKKPQNVDRYKRAQRCLKRLIAAGVAAADEVRGV